MAVAPTNYTYITPDQYTDFELYNLAGLKEIAATLKEEAPDELNEFIGAYLPSFNVSVEDLSTNKVVSYLIQAMYVANNENPDLVAFKQTFYDRLAPVVNSKVNAIAYVVPNQSMGSAFSGFLGQNGKRSGEEEQVTNDGGGKGSGEQQQNTGGGKSSGQSNVDVGNCNCDTACQGFNIYGYCYNECGCAGAMIPSGGWDSDTWEGSDGGAWTLEDSTIGQIFSGLGEGIQSAGNAIGWDNIWNSFFNTDDDGYSDDYPDIDITIEQEPTNYGKIALYTFLGVGVIAGGIYLYRRFKK